MSIKVKESTETTIIRLSYEVLIQSIELASVPKNAMFSLEFTKGSITINGNKKFSIDELTRQTDVNETFSFFQDQGGTLSMKDKQAEILLLMWRGDRYAIVSTYKLVLQVCAFKSTEAPFLLDNGDSVLSKLSFSVKCRKHVITPEVQLLPESQPETKNHGSNDHRNVEGRDSIKRKIEQNGKVVQNERSKSVGKIDKNIRNSSQEAIKQQQQYPAVMKESVECKRLLFLQGYFDIVKLFQMKEQLIFIVVFVGVLDLKSPRQLPGESDQKIKQQGKNQVQFKSFWRVNVDRAFTPRPQTERTHEKDSNQNIELENGKNQQIFLPHQEFQQSLTPDPKSTKSNPSVQQQQQQKQTQIQQQQSIQLKQKGDFNQTTSKPTFVQSQLVEEKVEQKLIQNIPGNPKKGIIIDVTKKQASKDINNFENVYSKKDRNGIVSPNKKTQKNHEIKSTTHDKTIDSINANIFLTPRTKTPTPTPRPVCYSSQQSSESSAKNSFFSEHSSSNNVLPSNQKQLKGQETSKIKDNQKRHNNEKQNIHQEIINQLLGETPEETKEEIKGDSKISSYNNNNYRKEEGKIKKKGAFISAEIKKKIQQLSQSINEHSEDLEDKAIIQTPIANKPPTQIQIEEEPEQRPSLTKMKDFKIKKLSEIEQIEALISQMKLEGERNHEPEGHSSILETVGFESTQAHQESHIEIEDETIPSEGESAEEDSPAKPSQLNYKEMRSEKQNQCEIEEQKQENSSEKEITNNYEQTIQNMITQQKEEIEKINQTNLAELQLAKHALLLSQQEKQLMTQQIDILRKQNTELSSQVQSAAHNYITTLGQLQSENTALALRVQSQMTQIANVPAVETEISLRILTEQNNDLQKESVINLETIKKQQDQIFQQSREIEGMKIDAADKDEKQAKQIEAFKNQIQYLEVAIASSKKQANLSEESVDILSVVEEQHKTNQLQQEEINYLKKQVELLNQQKNEEVAQTQEIDIKGVGNRLEQENKQLNATIQGLNEKIQLMSSQLDQQHQQLILKNSQQKQPQHLENGQCEIKQDQQTANQVGTIEKLNIELSKVKLEQQSAKDQLIRLQEMLSKSERENKQLTEEIIIIKSQQTGTFGKPFSFEGLPDQQQQLLQAQMLLSFSPHQGQSQQITKFENVQIGSSQTENTSSYPTHQVHQPANGNQQNSVQSGNNKNENVNTITIEEQSRISELNLKRNKDLLAQKQQEYDKLQNLYSLYYQKAQNLEQINQNLEFELLQTKQDFCEALNIAFERGGNELLDLIEKNSSFREYKPKISEFR